MGCIDCRHAVPLAQDLRHGVYLLWICGVSVADKAPTTERYLRMEISVGGNVLRPVGGDADKTHLTVLTHVNPGGIADTRSLVSCCVLRCVAGGCCLLQRVAECCGICPCDATHCNTLQQCVAVYVHVMRAVGGDADKTRLTVVTHVTCCGIAVQALGFVLSCIALWSSHVLQCGPLMYCSVGLYKVSCCAWLCVMVYCSVVQCASVS